MFGNSEWLLSSLSLMFALVILMERLRRKPKEEEVVESTPKRVKKIKPPINLVCLLRSGRYKNEEQLKETLTQLFFERKRETMLFLILHNKGPLKDWLVDNEFEYSVYNKRKGEEESNRNYRLLNDARAIVAFIPRASTGDKHWDYITGLLEMNKNLYLVYDENGVLWDKKRRERAATPYAQDS